jgi:hypothetical protein
MVAQRRDSRWGLVLCWLGHRSHGVSVYSQSAAGISMQPRISVTQIAKIEWRKIRSIFA